MNLLMSYCNYYESQGAVPDCNDHYGKGVSY